MSALSGSKSHNFHCFLPLQQRGMLLHFAHFPRLIHRYRFLPYPGAEPALAMRLHSVGHKLAGSAQIKSVQLKWHFPIFASLSVFLYSGAEDQRHAWTRRVYKTIFVIMLIELIGWGSNSLYVWMQHADMVPTALTAWLQTSQYTNWYFNKLYSYIVCVALVANVPALYICRCVQK